MRRHNDSQKKPGRKRLIFSLVATLTGLASWQHLEGIGLGDRQERGFSRTRQMIDDPATDPNRH